MWAGLFISINTVLEPSYVISKARLQEALSELYSLRDLLRWGLSQFQMAKLFYGHGTDNAWDEIIYLVLSVLKLGPRLNSQWLSARLTLQERRLVMEKIQQRVNERIPTAYLVNQAWFAGLPFYVDTRVLIPRSSIAELIEQQFSPWLDTDGIKAILDMGTGSGCMAIACAYALPQAQIDAVDSSEDALAVAAINVATHQQQGRIHLIQSNLFQNLKEQHYDIIISNPPYVDAEDFSNLPVEYRHEPAIALAAGGDGLDFVIEILKQAKQHLRAKGILIVEVGNSKAALVRRFPYIPFLWLAFERGCSEVFLLTQAQLNAL